MITVDQEEFDIRHDPVAFQGGDDKLYCYTCATESEIICSIDDIVILDDEDDRCAGCGRAILCIANLSSSE